MSNAQVLYSEQAAAAVLLLADGTWVPGVRVESASFSLLIPALLNAYSTAIAAGRFDIVAATTSYPLTPAEIAFLQATPRGPFDQVAEDTLAIATTEPLPIPGQRLDPFLEATVPDSPEEGISLARLVAELAYVPESAFQVGCVLVTSNGKLVPGVNVEHQDWTHILCAERNALSTAISYGIHDFETLYLTCLRDASGTPCGACRQLLVELAPTAQLWMDRGDRPPANTRPDLLLPGAFSGKALTEVS